MATQKTNALAVLHSTSGYTRSAMVLDEWHEPGATYFKVQTYEGKVCLLRYDGQEDEWTLLSGFDGDELLARPGIQLVTLEENVIHPAEKLIKSCERCHPEDADIPLYRILYEVTGQSGATTDYILTEPARCPSCKDEISEKTLVKRKHD